MDDSSPANIRSYTVFAKYQTGCEDYAKKKLKQLGGGAIYILTPKRNPGFTTLPKYHDIGTGWFHHYVVVKDGKVYDRFTGVNGVSLEKFYSQWDDFFEEIQMISSIIN